MYYRLEVILIHERLNGDIFGYTNIHPQSCINIINTIEQIDKIVEDDMGSERSEKFHLFKYDASNRLFLRQTS